MNESDPLATPAQPATEPTQPASKPEAVRPDDAERSAKHTRRIFLFKLSLGLNAVAGAILAVPVLGYVLAPMFRKDASYNSWIPLMAVDAIPVGATRLVEYENPARFPTDGATDKVACWSRRLTESTYEVFAINCAHLGCPVRWFEQSQLFLCPCHGGAYYANGDRASGPPPRGLFKYKLRYAGGQVWIDAGEMPTVATQACNDKSLRPLVQIKPASPDDGQGRVGSEA